MYINIRDLSGKEQFAIREVAAEIGLAEAANGLKLRVIQKKTNGFKIFKSYDCCIEYGSISQLLRALVILSTRFNENFTYEEKLQCENLGLMADNSRNAVLNIPTVKKLIRKSALLGFNSLQLYTEDTYEVENQPYFGYMRGRFSCAELRILDDYANNLGIELVPCIQTLAHLNGLMHWQPYQEIIDTADIILSGNEKTYELIEDMFKSIRKCFKSNKINIGMDEAQLIGAGQYFNQNGYTPKYDILKKHLDRVLKICEKYGFKAKMWSDMFFRNWFKGNYYVTDKSVPDYAKGQIPKDVEIVYWDYYHNDAEFYKNMLDLHLSVSDNVGFAGGAWKWSGFAPLTSLSLNNSAAALKSVVGKANDIFLTAWGDNGAECSIFSIMPVMAFYAEKCYCSSKKITDEIFKKIFDLSFSDFVKLEDANRIGTKGGAVETNNSSKYFLFNDLFYGIFDSNVDNDTAAYFKENTKILKAIGEKSSEFSYMYDTLAKLCDALALKVDMGKRITTLYKAKDKQALEALAKNEIESLLQKVRLFYDAFAKQWHTENKAYGLEVQDYRIGGLIARINSCKKRILEYAESAIESIEELEEDKLDFMGKETFSKDKDILYNNFAFTATAQTF